MNIVQLAQSSVVEFSQLSAEISGIKLVLGLLVVIG